MPQSWPAVATGASRLVLAIDASWQGGGRSIGPYQHIPLISDSLTNLLLVVKLGL